MNNKTEKIMEFFGVDKEKPINTEPKRLIDAQKNAIERIEMSKSLMASHESFMNKIMIAFIGVL